MVPIKSIQKQDVGSILSFIAMAGIIAFFFGYVYLKTPYSIGYSSLGLYFGYASKTVSGLIPYHDFTVEYPPLALAFFVMPRLFADSYADYKNLFKIMVYIFCIAGLCIAGLAGKKYRIKPWKMMMAYTAGICVIGPILPEQYDIFAAILTMGALYSFLSEHRMTAWFLLALGTAAKLYPVFLVPLFLALYLPDAREGLKNKNRRSEEDDVKIGGNENKERDSSLFYRDPFYRTLLKPAGGLFVFITTCLLVSLPFILVDAPGFLSFLTYHMDRGLQIESLASSFIMMGYIGGVRAVSDIAINFSFGSINVGGLWPDRIARLLTPLMLAAFTVIYALFIKTVLKKTETPMTTGEFASTADNARLIMMTAFLIVLVFILAGKVFSPQYMIWLLPFIPYVLLFRNGRNYIVMPADESGTESPLPPGDGHVCDKEPPAASSEKETDIRSFPETAVFSLSALFLFLISGLLTYQIFPTHYLKLYTFEKGVVCLLFVRNVCLLILLVFIILLSRRSAADILTVTKKSSRMIRKGQRKSKKAKGINQKKAEDQKSRKAP